MATLETIELCLRSAQKSNKTLMNGTGVSVADLRIPAPERAFDFEPASESDRASLTQSALDAKAGDVWRKHVLDRISEQHAGHDIFVAWAARRLSRKGGHSQLRIVYRRKKA